MLQKIFKMFAKATTVTLISASLVLPISAFSAEQKTIKIGWTAWSDAEAVTNIAKQILEQKLGYKVELLMTDIGLQYQGVAKGNLDIMLMSWLPTTHKAYWDKLSSEVVDMGIIYDNAKLGWAVPTYIPASEVKTIEDLKKPQVKERLKGSIQGIDPGAGLMRASETAIKTYGLDGYKLLASSDAGMIVSLDRAVKKKDWIVVTTWTPHWMFSKYQIRYLEDPKGALGGAEAIHAVSRKGFDKDFVKAAAFIKNFKISIKDLESVMMKAKGSSYEKEAAAYIKNNPDVVKGWLKDAQ